ncbi:MAG TPA: lysophospholipid acyltransferase family protein [Pyrinomonadaceae bacterium]|jgi:KDO2-lipid IV(A) lauroyltransferase
MAPKSKTQIRAEFIAARTLFGVIGSIPRGLAASTTTLVSRIGYRVLGRLRRIAERNLEIALPGTSPEQRLAIVKGTFENLGRMLADTSKFGSYSRDDLAKLVHFDFTLEQIAEHERIRAEGRGAILLSPHLGNWEMLVFAYSAAHGPISYLARPLDNPLIEELTLKNRTRFGNRPINKSNSVSEAVKVLRHGGLLGVLADVNAHPKEGVFVPFFGIPACTSAGPALLAMRTNALIVPIACVWDQAAGHYRVIQGSVIEPALSGNREADILRTTAAFTSEVEKLVREYPEQWLWIHKRWKTRPPGEKELY